MSSPSFPTLRDLHHVTRERARAEAAEWAAMVGYRDGALSRLRRDATPMRQMLERSAVTLQIAAETGMSEGQVVNRLAAADRVVEHAPKVWAAFGRGHLDAGRVREISLTIEKLERDDSRQRLDDEAVPYGRTHTLAELRRWLRRFVARVEADLTHERAETERAKRHVRVEHTDDGMAWLQAYLPSHQAAAIENRLERLAKTHQSTDKAEGLKRSHAQRRTDLLVHLLTSAPADHLPGTPGLRCDIAVTIDAAVLTGATEGAVEAADGSWQVPTDWLLESAFAGEAFWHRMLLDPITANVLAHEFAGYRAAALVRSSGRAKPACRAVASASEPRTEREGRARPGTIMFPGPKVRPAAATCDGDAHRITPTRGTGSHPRSSTTSDAPDPDAHSPSSSRSTTLASSWCRPRPRRPRSW